MFYAFLPDPSTTRALLSAAAPFAPIPVNLDAVELGLVSAASLATGAQEFELRPVRRRAYVSTLFHDVEDEYVALVIPEDELGASVLAECGPAWAPPHRDGRRTRGTRVVDSLRTAQTAFCSRTRKVFGHALRQSRGRYARLWRVD